VSEYRLYLQAMAIGKHDYSGDSGTGTTIGGFSKTHLGIKPVGIRQNPERGCDFRSSMTCSLADVILDMFL